jgi:hypothetical protein
MFTPSLAARYGWWRRRTHPDHAFEQRMAMPEISESDALGGAAPNQAAEGKMRAGLIGSVLLHLLVLLLAVLSWPWLMQALPPPERAVPVNLVQLGEITTSPPSTELANLPQARAEEIAESESVEAVPVAQEPPPPMAHQSAEESSMPDLLTAPQKAIPEVPKPVKTRKPDGLPAAKVRQPSSPADALSARLKQLAQLRQPDPPIPANPRRQDGSGASDVTATSANAAPAQDATYGVKDFIRAQIERRWNLDGAQVKSADWAVAIHIMLRPDGSVSQADIVDNPLYRSSPAYRDFARSARNAVLLSSPIAVPPGAYDIAKDIILDFNLKRLSQ